MAVDLSWVFKKSKPEPVSGWESAFADSRAHGHNTDAYTFQIAWAYAEDHFKRQPRFSETSCSQCGKDLGPGDAGVSSCSEHGA
ncbi:hypothetical protein [Paraburkholderia unamae]|uniref:Uncharacterized protein n=1 Tax=Paraburkholderia unamae TaxID=219649 RepID=A0ABX5KAT3_9BURK|nr:hypothetical protein [Paraburkholderia unamae]PVX61275.1 hypothetical protein C7402_14268 [Paraburkholderia unamae]